MKKRLYLSSKNKIIGGVCGGISEFFDLEPSIFRIIFVLLVVLFRGFPIVLYIFSWAIIPKNNEF